MYLSEKNPQERQGFVVLDVRYERELKKWKLPEVNDFGQRPKVINIDLPSLKANYAEHVQTIPKDKLVFCLCYVGYRSGQAVQLLQQDNIRAINIEGGLSDLNKLDPELYPLY